MGHTRVPLALHSEGAPDLPWGMLRSHRPCPVSFQVLDRASGVAYTGGITQIRWVSYRRQDPVLVPAVAPALAEQEVVQAPGQVGYEGDAVSRGYERGEWRSWARSHQSAWEIVFCVQNVQSVR